MNDANAAQPAQNNAEKIKSWRWRRVKAGLNLEELAVITSKTAPQLSNYETGKVQPGADTIDKIEAALTARGV